MIFLVYGNTSVLTFIVDHVVISVFFFPHHSLNEDPIMFFHHQYLLNLNSLLFTNIIIVITLMDPWSLMDKHDSLPSLIILHYHVSRPSPSCFFFQQPLSSLKNGLIYKVVRILTVFLLN